MIIHLQPVVRAPHAGGKPRKPGNRGAVILTVAITMLFLLGMMGLAIDFGRLFVVKTELQTAVDSCALAAAHELNGASDALTRATSAGLAITASNRNNVLFQTGGSGIAAADITFADALNGTYSATFTPVSDAKYARCEVTRGGMAPLLLQAMRAFSGNATFSATQDVWATAVATRTSAQSACAIPVQIRPKVGGTAPDYGYAAGEWIPSVYAEGAGGGAGKGGGSTDVTNDLAPGHFGWANLDGTTNANVARDHLLGNGFCNLTVGTTIGSPGVMASLSTAWNSRFGLYKNGVGNPSITDAKPDLTGYSYTGKNWPPKSGALSDFLAKRAGFRSYGDTTDSVNAGDTITGLTLPGAYQSADMATHGAGARALAVHGAARRLVVVPVVSSASAIIDFACVLMLHPIDGPKVTVNLEYVGNAKAAGSPCTTAGLPGGSAGPLVPVLVR